MAAVVRQRNADVPGEVDLGEVEDVEFAKLFDEHLRAGYQAIYVPTAEEARLETEIARVAKKLKMGVISWDCYEGFSLDSLKSQAKFKSPIGALEALADDTLFTGNQVFLFRDLDDYFVDAQVRRRIRSLCEGNRLVNKRFKRPLVIISPRLQIHEKLKSSIAVVEFSLPGETKLRRTLEFVHASIESKDPAKAVCNEELADSIVACLMGLTSNEAENCLARCLVRHSGFKQEMLATIKDEKASIVKKSGTLTYIPEDDTASRQEIGGFEEFLAWADRRRLAYAKEARAAKLDYPKGVVLLGLPGTGKSYVALALGRLLGLPTYILDIGAVFGSLVGESEQKMDDAIRQIEAQRGSVVLIDEADKAWGGAADSQGDSGVTKRVFGKFLTWLAKKKDRTFVVMTLNRTKGIPPEFLRAGRFDAIFYTDLPNVDERRAIFDIHLAKRGVEANQLGLGAAEWKQLITKTNGFVGSEIEEVVVEAKYLAWERRRSATPNFEELFESANGIIPLSQRDEEGMRLIREYCKDKAKPVSKPPRQRPMATVGGRTARAINVDDEVSSAPEGENN